MANGGDNEALMRATQALAGAISAYRQATKSIKSLVAKPKAAKVEPST